MATSFLLSSSGAGRVFLRLMTSAHRVQFRLECAEATGADCISQRERTLGPAV